MLAVEEDDRIARLCRLTVVLSVAFPWLQRQVRMNANRISAYLQKLFGRKRSARPS